MDVMAHKAPRKMPGAVPIDQWQRSYRETFAKGLREHRSKRATYATGEVTAKTLARSLGMGDKVTGSGNPKSALLWPRWVALDGALRSPGGPVSTLAGTKFIT